MKKYLSSLLFLAVLVVFSCKPDDSADPIIVSPPVEVVETIIPVGDERYLHEDSDYIFDQDTLRTFELNLPAAALAKLDADPAAEVYVEGSLTFEGETISPVGIRYKGSIGAFVGCLSGQDWGNPSGHKTCTKLSMKVKLNWDDPDSKFYGLKKLQFHSMNLDPSQMRDRLGYWLFREMGVPAPRAVHAQLMINGKYSGLYSLVEVIDGRFTKQNFDDGDGNLYKEVWPLNMYGMPRFEQEYLSHLETNEEASPTANMIRSFAQEISNANSSNIQGIISNWMKIPEIMAYCAVDRTIRVDDGPFHWYCDGGDCSNHNYFWYEEPTAGTMHLIPWDMDNAFENIISNVNPVTPIGDPWGEITNNCQPFKYGLFQLEQRSAACDKLTVGWVSFANEYEQALSQFKAGPFSEAQVNARLDAWEAQVRQATVQADQAHNDAITVYAWENALYTLKNNLEYARSQ
ncbi:MAG: CotH kinase family protein [Saprospiraceae bacterium]|nr:CotH kinase family protein [Saprospiraceae bacterium]MCF8248420.1 CotH kinase family protein [Saprospiraceae bacterium]MCF8280091.1 CotH kinase family protein [Bacteroidales bacterium]MCF8309948.1 CotH kinase family protein [Saprospiraceae bacterium]MCF8438721.1 CotH kinase family protein [Saprospiraceae bacterium]